MYRAGISYAEFGKLTMRDIRFIAKAYSEKLEEDFKAADVMAYIQGRYMVDALLCTVGNMFSSKGTNFDYPEKAYSATAQIEQLSEEDIENQRQQFIASLQMMQLNFNLNKEKNGE